MELARRMKVALVARSVFPLHGYGGLERHVYDLARALAERDVEVTLITRPPIEGQELVTDRHPSVDPRGVRPVPHVPGRRTPRHDGARSQHGLSALRPARRTAGARARPRRRRRHRPRPRRERARLRARPPSRSRDESAATAPLVMNPQGLEEFGATDPSRAPLKRAAYLPLRKAVLVCAAAADAVIATDRSLEPVVLRHLGIPPRADADDPERARPARRRRADRSGRRRRPAAAAPISSSASGCCSASAGSKRARAFTSCSARWPPCAITARSTAGRGDGSSLGDGPYRPMLEMLADELGLQRARPLPRPRDGSRDARVARALDAVRAPDALRGQLARHARGDGAPPRGRRVGGGRHSRQGAARARTAGWSRRAIPRRWPRRSAAPSAIRPVSRATASPAAPSSSGSSRGRPRATPRSRSTESCSDRLPTLDDAQGVAGVRRSESVAPRARAGAARRRDAALLGAAAGRAVQPRRRRAGSHGARRPHDEDGGLQPALLRLPHALHVRAGGWSPSSGSCSARCADMWNGLAQAPTEEFYVWGRAVTAILGTATVWIVYRVGMRWGGADGAPRRGDARGDAAARARIALRADRRAGDVPRDADASCCRCARTSDRRRGRSRWPGSRPGSPARPNTTASWRC